MQEFGKLSSKILADRLNEIFLRNPEVMTEAQRAFLRNGNIQQCLHTLVDVLEDWQTKKKKANHGILAVVAYDQVKAYDSVQPETIRASLERFNMPEQFISYILSNLEEATYCFKTFYGPSKPQKPWSPLCVRGILWLH